jgi:heme/copper-type cytochrome/quinol oxidase subunit 4
MKAIYTILFFADTLILVVLAYLFLKLMDKGASGWMFSVMLFAIISCVIFLAYLLSHYLKLPSSHHKK